MRCSFHRLALSFLCSLFLIVAVVQDAFSAAITFPNNGTNQLVNVIRRYNNGLPLYTLGGGTPGAVFDGGHSAFQWNGITTSAPQVLQVTLDDIYPLRRFQADYTSPPWVPNGGYKIEVSTTGFGALTTVVNNPSAPSGVQVDTLGSAVNAKYIQYTWNGPGGAPGPNAVILHEIQAFADASAGLKTYNATGSFNVAALQGSAPLTFTDLTVGKWLDPIAPVADRNIQSYLRGNGTGDAIFRMDLGGIYKVDSIGLGFYSGQAWGNGMKIEGSMDNVSYTTLYDVSTSVSSSHVNVTDTLARYLRVTDKNGNTGALTEFEVYADPLSITSNPASGSTIDLGRATQGGSITLSDAIQLQNTDGVGTQITINSFNVTGPDGSSFTIPDFAVTTLTAGGIDSVLFDLKFNAPNAIGGFSGLLEIVTSEGSLFYNLTAQAVPEPSTFALLGIGLAGYGIRRRRVKNT